MNILQMSLYGAVLIVAVIIIRALSLYKLPKKTFIILWTVAVLRLITPFSISSTFSIYTWIDKVKGANTLNVVTDFTTDMTTSTNIVSTNINDIPINTGQVIAASKQGTFISPFIVAWLVGLFILGLFFIIAYIRCHKEFSLSLPINNNFISKWQSKNSLYRKVQIRQSDKIRVARTYGIFKPIILLPKTTDWQAKKDLNYILAHEYTHIRNFDAVKKLVLTLALCIHWFNPFVWIMYFLANRDIELACDESILQNFGEKTNSSYARTLINLEEKKNISNPIYNYFARNITEERVKMIMKYKKASIVTIVISLLVIVGVIVACGTNGKIAMNDNPQLTLDTIIQLSKKGEDLTWRDFEGYEYEDVGSGLYIHAYKTIEDNIILVGGPSPNEQPWYVTYNGFDIFNTAEETLRNSKPIKQTNIKEVTSLGSDSMIVDYMNDDILVFHGHMGLFIYDFTQEYLKGNLNLDYIGCNFTQGDNYCNIQVSNNGKTVYLHPIQENFMYVYDAEYNTLYKTDYYKADNLFEFNYNDSFDKFVYEGSGSEMEKIFFTKDGKKHQLFKQFFGESIDTPKLSIDPFHVTFNHSTKLLSSIVPDEFNDDFSFDHLTFAWHWNGESTQYAKSYQEIFNERYEIGDDMPQAVWSGAMIIPNFGDYPPDSIVIKKDVKGTITEVEHRNGHFALRYDGNSIEYYTIDCTWNNDNHITYAFAVFYKLH